jgi:p-cumate 2,3-dioxygenase beta subunit
MTLADSLLSNISRAEVESFLYEEADLLDSWRLEEWLELVTEDVRYVVPCTDLPGGDPRRDLVLVDDDIVRLRARVRRLLSPRGHREFPRSRTRRLVTNVRIVEDDGTQATVTANFAVYRARNEEVLVFVGKYTYRLRRAPGGGLNISFRRAELDNESLRPHGTMSIII